MRPCVLRSGSGGAGGRFGIPGGLLLCPRVGKCLTVSKFRDTCRLEDR